MRAIGVMLRLWKKAAGATGVRENQDKRELLCMSAPEVTPAVRYLGNWIDPEEDMARRLRRRLRNAKFGAY